LVEVTEEATDNALFQSEDLLRAIGHHGDTKGVHGMDLTHVVAKTRGVEDDEVDNPPRPRVDIATVSIDANKTLDPAVPHQTGSGAVTEKTPPTDAMRSMMVEDPQKELVPNGGQGTKPLGAGHPAGDNKALGKLRGLRVLGQTLSNPN
jgi:hypothetical protein